MGRTRRELLGLTGASVATLAAGCLDDSGSPGDGTGTPTDGQTATPVDRSQTPTDQPTGGQLPSGLGRVDEPPYEISAPDCDEVGTDDGGRDPLYLCANMASEPSLSFEQADSRGNVLADAGLEFEDGSAREMVATMLTDGSDRDRIADEADSDATGLIRQTDFDSHAVLVVETGWGSGSIYPHLKRVESTDTGVHAFGCHSDPCVQTDDYTSRTAVVRFERPETLETGVVSLTVAADERWNVAAGEGIVSIP